MACWVRRRPPSALHDLALAGDAKGLSAFLATKQGTAASLDAPDAYGFTPLQLATDRGTLRQLTIGCCWRTLYADRLPTSQATSKQSRSWSAPARTRT